MADGSAASSSLQEQLDAEKQKVLDLREKLRDVVAAAEFSEERMVNQVRMAWRNKSKSLKRPLISQLLCKLDKLTAEKETVEKRMVEEHQSKEQLERQLVQVSQVGRRNFMLFLYHACV
jgi:ribonuclease HI